jgi:hypothetical protein
MLTSVALYQGAALIGPQRSVRENCRFESPWLPDFIWEPEEDPRRLSS